MLQLILTYSSIVGATGMFLLSKYSEGIPIVSIVYYILSHKNMFNFFHI